MLKFNLIFELQVASISFVVSRSSQPYYALLIDFQQNRMCPIWSCMGSWPYPQLNEENF